MRIATVCFSKTTGGLELATLRRGSELQAHGHHVVSVLPDAPELIRHAERLGLSVDRVTPSIPYLDLPGARKLSMVIAREEIELLLVGRTRDLSTAMLAAGREVAVVLYQQMQSGLDKHDWFHNKVFRRLDGCITITTRDRDAIVANTVISPDKTTVIPYGIDVDHFSPENVSREEARRTFKIPEDAFVVGMVGGFTPGKGQKEFLEALRIVAGREENIASQLHAILVGERASDSGEYRAELRALRDALPLAECVSFHPFLDDPRLAFRAFDLFVLASHSETFGMVVQEALAMGVPSIATDSGGVPEIISTEENGILVPPKDPEAIAEAIIRLFNDGPLRSRLADAGRKFTRDAYHPARQYSAFEHALEEAVARRKQEGKGSP